MKKTTEDIRRLPAEWEPQDAILLAWPHAETDWGPVMDQIVPVYLELTQQISRFQQVLIIALAPETVADELTAAGLDSSKIKLYQERTNDTWARDFGPMTIFQQDTVPRLLDFTFNGWGGKFPACLDNQTTRSLHSLGAFGSTSLETHGLVLEGGSIESDGTGTLMTTSRCLGHPNRNPELSQAELEHSLRQTLGAKQVIWLKHGSLAGDDTDTHIDTLARFCPDSGIIYVRCDDPQDQHYAELSQMEEELRAFKTLGGNSYNLFPLPWPRARFDDSGQRLPATYANFLIINQAVLVPTYADPADALALETIGKAFPEREIIGIDCRPVIEQGGSLHCLTMQLPQGVLL